jgi:hypothetical protein
LDYSAEKDNAALLNVAREILHGAEIGRANSGRPADEAPEQAGYE